MTEPLRAPYPWYGGKSRAADVIWRAFGDPPNFVEPFFGSGAVMLSRPGGAGKIETANDLDADVPNFWRAITHDPDAVAHHVDWPVSEVDVHARHRWLVATKRETRERLMADPEFFDAKRAGYWCYGACCWIGSGWCAERPDGRLSSEHTRPHLGRDVLANAPQVHRKIPDLYARGFGKGAVGLQQTPSQQIPSLNGGGRGALAPSRLPSLGNARGVHGADAPPCRDWFRALAERLRRVRFVCGDWTRVLGDSVIGTTKSRNSGMNPCAILFDPPYGGDERDPDLYAEDSGDVAKAVADWAREHGDDPDLRIALCGYEGEHEMPASWTVHRWKALRGYANADNDNRHRETIWFSPHCLPIDHQRTLFGDAS